MSCRSISAITILRMESILLNRRDRVASVIRFHKADLVGMREVLRDQIGDLEILLPQYGWIGVGRDDGADGGEFSPIFYRKDRFTVLDSGTFWLSETPEVTGSKAGIPPSPESRIG